ncbi:MAG: hypothetical protein U5N26_11425 [Candidatus Marinimicrobia bacterium]|nr:hypothetical protein [Candidatus Neomarinimicrobiota bacterium]
MVTDPVPAGVVYVPLSAEGEDADIIFSINNGISYQSWPPTYTILDNDGKSIVKEATPAMVTHIRWEIKDPLQVNEQKKLEFMVEVK